MSSRFSSRYRRRQRAEASIPREDPLSEQLDEIAELASSLHSPVAEPLPGSATSLEETELEREETKNASVQGLIASTEEINQELGEEVSVGIPYTDEFPRVETPQDAVIPLSPTGNCNIFRRIWNGLRCAFQEDDSPERQPLLPIHNGETNGGGASREGTFIEFIWNHMLTESMREYLGNHRNLILLIVIVILAVVTIIAYFTGTLRYLVLYLRMIICWMANIFYENESPFKSICRI